MQFIATCKLGLESVVSMELRHLGLEVDAVEDARVCFSGGYEAMARACLWLRTAERVLMVVGSFPAASFEALFEGVKAIAWKQYLNRDSFIHVNGKSAKSTLFSVSDCQSIAKKAIVENLKVACRTDRLPETGEEVIVEIGILRDEVTVALDCCGAGLSRRGYRTWNVPAPIAETLGAAILLLSHYRPEEAFLDPMCGSGTMPIEAAMIANNMAVGLQRPFAAEKWGFLAPNVFAAAREEARDAQKQSPLRILGADIDPHAIDICKKHAKKAGVMVDWAVRPLKELVPTAEQGLLACNPPYGERMMERKEAEALYRDMRKAFDAMPSWRFSIISAHRDFERIYGQRADKRRKLSNGGMPCTLYQFFKKYF